MLGMKERLSLLFEDQKLSNILHNESALKNSFRFGQVHVTIVFRIAQ